MGAPADDLKSLLEQEKAAEAYALGRASPDQLGDPRFDFFYGIAALNAGHAGEGVLALERLLLTAPDHRRGRLELARGYFLLGEDQRARDEFEAVLATSAVAAEREIINRYLDAIRSRESSYQPSANVFVEAGIGFDSNANAGVKSSNLGVLGTLAPTSTANRSGSKFNSYAAGAQGTYPLAPGIALFGSIGIDGKWYHDSKDDIYNIDSISGHGGVSVIRDRNLYRAYAARSTLSVDNQRFLTTTSANGDWQHQLDPSNRLNFGLQYAWLRYTDTMSVTVLDQAPVLSQNTARNATFVGASAGWTHGFAHPLQPVFTLSGNLGSEHNAGHRGGDPTSATQRQQLSRDVVGVRAGVSVVPAPQWGASVGIGQTNSSYKAFFQPGTIDAARQDRTLTADASLSYFLDRNITLRAEYGYTEQRSNVPLYKYDRHNVALKVRYDFK